MTAQEALANMAEDADELERRGIVRPGYIRTRREELAAIRAELQRMEAALLKAQGFAAMMAEEHLEGTERLTMLAYVLIIIGMDPMVHMRRPIADFPIYRRAVELVAEKREEAGTSGTPWRERWSWADRNTLLNGLLMEARLDLGLKYFEPYLKRMGDHAKEAGTAAQAQSEAGGEREASNPAPDKG